MIHLNNLSLPFNGGYLIAGSNQVGVFMMDFLWLKVSNEKRPWYWPVPLKPRPPNGKAWLVRCQLALLTQPPPKATDPSHSFSFCFEEVKI